MTQLKPIENLFAVEVPGDAKDFGCVHIFQGEDVLYYPNDKGETIPIASAPCHCDLVEILFTTSNATEQQAAGVVESHLYPFDNTIMGFEDYRHYGYASCETAKESLQSLLRFNGLDASKNYLLIKKTT